MNLTPEQMEQGRRNFLKVLAGTPAMAALGAAAALRVRCRAGACALGSLASALRGARSSGPSTRSTPRCARSATSTRRSSRWPTRCSRRTRCPRRGTTRTGARCCRRKTSKRSSWPRRSGRMRILAVGCLEAGKHVLCEKMMAWDIAGCERMRAAAQKSGKVLEIGYQRNYSPMYQAAYDGIIKTGTLGDIYHVRLAWHRNGSWRRKGQPPSPDYDPSKWGYPTFDHLYNWPGLDLEVLPGADGGALQPSGQRRQLVPRVRARGRDRLRRPVPFPRQPGGLRSRVRHVRIPGRPHGGLLLDRIERLRRLLRDVFRHERHADSAARARPLLFEEGAGTRQTGIDVTPRGRARWRSRPKR